MICCLALGQAGRMSFISSVVESRINSNQASMDSLTFFARGVPCCPYASESEMMAHLPGVCMAEHASASASDAFISNSERHDT